MIATYDFCRDRALYLTDFFYGGEKLKNPSSLSIGSTKVSRKNYDSDSKDFYYTTHQIRSYLIPFEAEDDQKFKNREAGAYYFNLVSQVVNAYADSVTSKVSRNLGLLEPFVNNNVDYRDSTWSEFINQNAKMTALYGMTATYVDYTIPEGVTVNSRSDLKTKGLAPKCILISPLAFAWVDVNHFGEINEFAWYENVIEDSNANATVILRIVDKKGWKQVGAQVNFSKNPYEQVAASGQLITEGKHPASLKGKLPLVFNYFERIYNSSYPMGQSLVVDLVDVSRAVYNYNSWAGDIHQKASFPILTVPLAKSGGVMPPKTEMALGSNNALPYDSESGTPSFISAPTDSTRELRDQVNFMIQKAMSQLGLSLNLDQGSQIQSGEALKIRSREFEVKASKFASNNKKYEIKVLDLFKDYLGMSEQEIAITYPKVFSIPETSEDLTNALKLLDVPFLGTEGKLSALNQALSVALSLSDEQTTSILNESKAMLEASEVTTPPATS